MITKGTEKQITWANKIRDKYLELNLKGQGLTKEEYKKINFDLFVDFVDRKTGNYDKELIKTYKELKILDIIETQPNAKFWIENYKFLTDKYNKHTIERLYYCDREDLRKIVECVQKNFDRSKKAGFDYFEYCGIEVAFTDSLKEEKKSKEKIEMVQEYDRELYEFAEFLNIDISSFISKGYFIGIDGYSNALEKIAKSLKNENGLFEKTNNSKYFDSPLENKIIDEILRQQEKEQKKEELNNLIDSLENEKVKELLKDGEYWNKKIYKDSIYIKNKKYNVQNDIKTLEKIAKF